MLCHHFLSLPPPYFGGHESRANIANHRDMDEHIRRTFGLKITTCTGRQHYNSTSHDPGGLLQTQSSISLYANLREQGNYHGLLKSASTRPNMDNDISS